MSSSNSDSPAWTKCSGLRRVVAEFRSLNKQLSSYGFIKVTQPTHALHHAMPVTFQMRHAVLPQLLTFVAARVHPRQLTVDA